MGTAEKLERKVEGGPLIRELPRPWREDLDRKWLSL